MLKVVPSQRWGATAGVPTGWSVPLKNGFFDSPLLQLADQHLGRRRAARTAADYALTVAVGRVVVGRAGIEAVELVSRVVNAATSKPFGPFASTTQFVRNAVPGRARPRADLRRDSTTASSTSVTRRRARPRSSPRSSSRRARAERPVRAAALPGSARAAPGHVQLPIASGPAAPRAVDPARSRRRRWPSGWARGWATAPSSISCTSGRSAGPPTPRAARTGCGGSTRVPRGAVLMALTESPEARWERRRRGGRGRHRPLHARPGADRRRPGPLDRAARVGHLVRVLIDDLFRREEYAQRF